MIFLSQERIAQMILLSFIYGCVFGVIIDLIRLVRLILTPTNPDGKARIVGRAIVTVFNFAADLVLVIGFTVCALLFTYNMSGGVFRGVVYVMMALGVIAYSTSFGKLTVRANAWLSSKIKKLFRKISHMVSIPFRKIKKRIIKVYTLTIGKKIDKIKKESEEKKEHNDECLPTSSDMKKGYRKEGRISLGGKGSQ